MVEVGLPPVVFVNIIDLSTFGSRTSKGCLPGVAFQGLPSRGCLPGVTFQGLLFQELLFFD